MEKEESNHKSADKQNNSATYSALNTNQQDNLSNKQRPVFLSLLCIVVFVYSGLFTLLFISGVVFNSWIIETINDFIPEKSVERTEIIFLLISGIILYLFSFSGAYYIWRLKQKGFYIYLISTLLIIIESWIIGLGDSISTVILILLFLFFGIFYRKLN